MESLRNHSTKHVKKIRRPSVCPTLFIVGFIFGVEVQEEDIMTRPPLLCVGANVSVGRLATVLVGVSVFIVQPVSQCDEEPYNLYSALSLPHSPASPYTSPSSSG